jgi:hypothetical protein
MTTQHLRKALDQHGEQAVALKLGGQPRKSFGSGHLAYKICAACPSASVRVRDLGQPSTAVAACPALSAPVAVGVAVRSTEPSITTGGFPPTTDLRITSSYRHGGRSRAGHHELALLVRRCPVAFSGLAAWLAASPIPVDRGAGAPFFGGSAG